MNMSLSRQRACRGRELDVISSARDDAIARLETGTDTDTIAVTASDFDEPPREAFPRGMDEDVRPPGLHQHRFPGHDRHLLYAARIQRGRHGLSDQQLTGP